MKPVINPRLAVIPFESTVYRLLTAAGAVLIAKLASGELATGSQWWGGNVRTPWNIATGASGSSAGPAAAVAAGLVAFSVGTETAGSIIEPSATNGVTGLRPTHGAIGRSYCMALAQTMDKVGPLTRSVADAALLFDVLRGKDPNDQDTCNVKHPDPFSGSISVSNMTVGYINTTLFNADIPVIKGVEAAAYFDNWMRSGLLANSTSQIDTVPVLRRSRLIPAVEYIQAMRVRGLLLQEYLSFVRGLDAWITDAWTYVIPGNLVSFPQITVPFGFGPATYPVGYPRSTPRKAAMALGFHGLPYGESKILALAMAYQNITSFHQLRPPIDAVEPQLLTWCDVAIVLARIREAALPLTPPLGEARWCPMLVLSAELLNSAIEAVVDKVSPEFHELAGRAKDMGSAAVFVLLVLVALSWGLILWPRWF
ncbi:MAG: hypothetical protein WDW38_006345 [Sanguina aurantia]